jgi:hexosaminidase
MIMSLQKYLLLASASLVIIFVSCKKAPPSDLASESIIPAPVFSVATEGWFSLKKNSRIFIKGESDELKKLGQYFSDMLKPATGFDIDVINTGEKEDKKGIYFSIVRDSSVKSKEWYELNIEKKSIRLKAISPEGIFRGIQTLRQLLPAKIELSSKQQGPWKIATGTITDYPEYPFRGAMLDVSRHFFGVDDVKRYIDYISLYKLNKLHLVLSNDQGWRIEIKSWPNLALIGGSTQVGGGRGGYYTQEQYSEIIKYAGERYITIIPEIDMPGHTNAALASYAELNCDGKVRELYTGIKVGFSTLCTDREITYKFVEDVVREISALTPGPYFHIGGDESHSTKEKDYIKFIERVQDIVKSFGKTAIGWDEIASAKLVEGTIAQYWSKSKNAMLAAAQGRKVLFSPASRTYLDMKYDSSTVTGLHWAGYIEVDKAYNWDPATMVNGINKENIIGVEAPLWTETVTNMDEIEYMIFPRLAGIAEIGWTPAMKRDWLEYRERIARHGERFDAMGINYYKSKLIPWPGSVPSE